MEQNILAGTFSDRQRQLARRRLLRQLTGCMVTGGTLAFLTECIGTSQLATIYPHISRYFGDVLKAGDKAYFPAATPDQFSLNEAGIFYHAQAKTFIVHLARETPYLLTGTPLAKQLQTEAFLRDSDGSYWLALYERCVQLGTRSTTLIFRNGWSSFKCPSCGSEFNAIGEFEGGPAPRSMDRFLLSLRNDQLLINTYNAINISYPGTDDTPRLLALPLERSK